jgi:hypothetical protein
LKKAVRLQKEHGNVSQKRVEEISIPMVSIMNIKRHQSVFGIYLKSTKKYNIKKSIMRAKILLEQNSIASLINLNPN